jgi:predicted acyltransferase (DUF342 family)
LIPWPFIAFTIVFAALICAHFISAYRSWWASRGEQPSDIDPDYVKLEDYFGRSFRLKVSEWLDSPIRACMPDGTLLIKKGKEQIRASGSLNCPPQSTSDEILVVRGSFRCGEDCAFSREIYAYEDAAVGAGTRVQSIAADGNLVLGSNTHVARWVDSIGNLEIGKGCCVGARATAGNVLSLQNGARVRSAFAPTICVSSDQRETIKERAKALIPEIVIPQLVAGSGKSPQKTKTGGVDSRELHMLNTECWLYHGDLKPSAPIRINTKLIVKGDCVLPSGSVVEGDLKAEGNFRIGADSVCRGNVIADGDIWFGPASRFHGIVHAGKALHLSSGVRGGTESALVAVYAADTVTIEDDVIVHGKVASGELVKVAAEKKDSSVRRKTDAARIAAAAAVTVAVEDTKFN